MKKSDILRIICALVMVLSTLLFVFGQGVPIIDKKTMLIIILAILNITLILDKKKS